MARLFRTILISCLLFAPPALAQELVLNVKRGSIWEPGVYTYRFELDGRIITCEGKLPLSVCYKPNVVCDAEGIRIDESGCLWKSTQHQYGDIHIDGSPQRVAVLIERDGESIAEEVFIPDYTRVKKGQALSLALPVKDEGMMSKLIDLFE